MRHIALKILSITDLINKNRNSKYQTKNMLFILLAFIIYVRIAHMLREQKVLDKITAGNYNQEENEQVHLLSLINAAVSTVGVLLFLFDITWILPIFRQITFAYFLWDTIISILHHFKSPASIKKYHIMFLTILHHIGTGMFIYNVELDKRSYAPMIGYYIADITTFIVFRTWLAMKRKENSLDIKVYKHVEFLTYFVLRVFCLPLFFFAALPLHITLFTLVIFLIYVIVYLLNLMWFIQIFETLEK